MEESMKESMKESAVSNVLKETEENMEILHDAPFSAEEMTELGMNTAQDELYDEHADEKDETWVKKRFSVNIDIFSLNQDLTDVKSDAILTCPACFTVVCYHCQKFAHFSLFCKFRHDFYDQYRAVFVQNCCVFTNRFVKPVKGDDGATYHPVHCNNCKIDVGVRDQDDVVHFYQVLASIS